MGENRLRALQQARYTVFVESKALKVALSSPPWDEPTLKKAVNLAKFLSSGNQTVVTNSDRLDSWLDKYSFSGISVNRREG